LYALGVLILATAFVGSRLAFVALHWEAYRSNLIGIFWPLTSGYIWPAGALAGLAAGALFGRARELVLGPTLDALTPAALVGAMVISAADFLGGPGYGLPSNGLPGIVLYGIRRHPVQLYEIVVALAALAACGPILARRRRDGQLFLGALAIWSAGRLVVEAYRANAWLTDGGYRVLQIIALVLLVTALMALGRLSAPLAKHE
jgi:prolipoprotein diacylglyceryltransferase